MKANDATAMLHELYDGLYKEYKNEISKNVQEAISKGDNCCSFDDRDSRVVVDLVRRYNSCFLQRFFEHLGYTVDTSEYMFYDRKIKKIFISW